MIWAILKFVALDLEFVEMLKRVVNVGRLLIDTGLCLLVIA